MTRNFFVNPTQSVSRKPWFDHIPTLCSGTMIYCFQHKVTLSGLDHLSLMGFPAAQSPHAPSTPKKMGPSGGRFTDDECRDLAGNAFFVPIFTMLVNSFWLCDRAPWW
jgi:hypothetical protein